MALSRRPARFQRQNSMNSSSKTITPEKLQLLRAAAARVYINEEKPAAGEDSMANKSAAAAETEFEKAKEEDPAHGVKLLAAAAAIEILKAKKNEDPHVGKKQL